MEAINEPKRPLTPEQKQRRAERARLLKSLIYEVDTKADMDQFDSAFDYYEKEKTKLLDFGVEKAIWLFTKSRKVWIAEAGKDWLIRDWNHPVEVMPGCQFVPDELVKTAKK